MSTTETIFVEKLQTPLQSFAQMPNDEKTPPATPPPNTQPKSVPNTAHSTYYSPASNLNSTANTPQFQGQQRMHFAQNQQQPMSPFGDMSQTHAIMQLQSQMLAMSMNSPQRDMRRDNDAMLAYQMGEKLGALGKTDEAYRTSIAQLQNDSSRYQQELMKASNELKTAEAELEHQKTRHETLQREVERHKAALEQLNASNVEVKKEFSFRTQERSRLLEDVKQLAKQLSHAKKEMLDHVATSKLQHQKASSSLLASLKEVAFVKQTLADTAQRQRDAIAQMEARNNAQLAQQQRQIQALAADVRAIHSNGSPVGGVYSLLLALAMPFVSPERIVSVLGVLGRGVQSMTAQRSLRRIWTIALALDAAARIAAFRGLHLKIPKTVHDLVKPSLSTRRAKTALRVAKTTRILFEIITVIQLLLALRSASQRAGKRASDAWRRFYGRPSKTAQVIQLDNDDDDDDDDDNEHDEKASDDYIDAKSTSSTRPVSRFVAFGNLAVSSISAVPAKAVAMFSNPKA